MRNDRVGESVFSPGKSGGFAAGSFFLNCGSVLIVLFLLAPPLAYCQEAEAGAETSPPPETESSVMPNRPARPPVASEVSVMGMIPDGDYRLFSATVRCYAWTLGVEYDRHSFGHFLGSHVDYVAEVLPYVRLSQPAVSDFWGNALSPNQEVVHGLSVSPFGLRFLWRSDKALKFYMSGKLGAIAFTKKAFSPDASYANFNVQAAFGFEVKLTQRMDLRVEPFTFFHVSNGYLAQSNPGMDELASQYGISYHLGKQGQGR